MALSCGVSKRAFASVAGADGSAFSPNRHILAYTQSAEQGKKLVLWSYTETRVQEIPLNLAPDETPESLTFSPDGKLLGACVGQRTQLWSPDPNGPRYAIPLRHGALCAFGFRSESRELAYTNGDDIVTLGHRHQQGHYE